LTEHSQTDGDLSSDHRYAHLDLVDRGLAEMGRRPRLSVYVFTGLAVAVAWIWLIFLTAGVSQSVGPDAVGPGMTFWQGLLERIDAKPADDGFIAFILKICTPLAPGGFTAGVFFSTFLMWMAMSLAMMLPSAGAMIRTYGDIADVARQKSEPVVPLFILVLGYLTVWAAFSVIMTFFQLLLIGAGLAADPVFPSLSSQRLEGCMSDQMPQSVFHSVWSLVARIWWRL
jgi:predicted metal-binding membrane protein